MKAPDFKVDVVWVPNSAEIARLCRLDTDLNVTDGDVKGYLAKGDKALERFAPEERSEIVAAIIKGMAS
jgi:hypothetical protein